MPGALPYQNFNLYNSFVRYKLIFEVETIMSEEKFDKPESEELDLNVSHNEGEEEEQLPLRLGDDLIAVIRELVQLTLITGTNIVDHFRAIRCEVDPETNKIIPTEQYTESYNNMVEELEKQARQAAAALAAGSAETITPEDLSSGKFGFGLANKDDKDLN